MTRITERQLRQATWVKQFEHGNFRAFTTDAAPGFALLHRDGMTEYRVKGKGTTDSVSQAVRWYNEIEDGKRGSYLAPGSVEALRAARGK